MRVENERYSSLQAQMKNELADKDAIIQKEQSEKKKLKEELNETQNALQTEKNNLASMTRQKLNLDEEVALERSKVDSLQKELAAQRDLTNFAEKEIVSLKSKLDNTLDLLDKEKANVAELNRLLAEEKNGRAQDNESSKSKLELVFNQAKLDIKAKQTVIKKLEDTNANLNQKMKEESEKSQQALLELNQKYSALRYVLHAL
jgi:hypothetical protein